jgi:hypothetical protein
MTGRTGLLGLALVGALAGCVAESSETPAGTDAGGGAAAGGAAAGGSATGGDGSGGDAAGGTPAGGSTGGSAGAGGDPGPEGGTGGDAPRPDVGPGGAPGDDAAVTPADAGPPPDPDIFVPPGDRDDDGVPDERDNCPGRPNNNQLDTDADGHGDVCDVCPEVADPDQADEDADGRGDVCDLDDTDGDGVPDRQDDCPAAFDPAQADGDNDGVGDACDNCPETPNFSQMDADGDGRGDACELPDDDDADGVPDADDNCPTTGNANQTDRDSDGRGDACDNCPVVPNFSQTDDDGDGVGNACEGQDSDGDGFLDDADNCPETLNADQAERDGDGFGDACDVCPAVPDPGQADADGDAVGDACDACPRDFDPFQDDVDADGLGDVCDNCPATFNPQQTDSNGDGEGDACEAPVTDLRVEATWNAAAVDLDLHLLGPAGRWYDDVHDLHFANRRDVPFADSSDIVDQTQGPGPEVLTASGLEPGIYHLGVFFYSNQAGIQPSVTVTVQCGAIEAAFGPQVLVDANSNGSPADLWQVTGFTWPDCAFFSVEPAGTPIVSLSNCAVGGQICGECPTCVAGPCAGVDCGELSCDGFTGVCFDPCADIRCAADEYCDRGTAACLPRLGICDGCVDDADCGFAGTDRCITHPQDENVRFCTRSCENQACPDGSICATDANGNDVCQPATGACVNVCEAGACQDFFGNDFCDPLDGGCSQDPPCHFNADCPGAYCRLTDRACIPRGAGQVALGGACQASSDCAAALACHIEPGICVRPCDRASDCGAGFHCEIARDGQLRLCVRN